MAKLWQVQTEVDRSHVKDLFWEYLQWANGRVNEEFNVDFDIKTMLKEDMEAIEIYLPPEGRLILVSESEEVAGLGCLKKIRDDIGEIKRMYIRPKFRGRGLGRTLLDKLLSEAKEVGYSKVRLDSARFMHAAHSLYRSAGFQDIDPYRESEIPSEFQEHWIFMEKILTK